MRPPPLDRKIVLPLVVLSVTQIIGWGTVGLPAIVGRQIASDLDMDISSVFAGTSVLYVAMGVCAPFLAKAFAGFGARRLLIGGTILTALGFLLLASSAGPVWYFASWVMLGAAGAATLTTAANIMLNELAGRNTKNAIVALMLLTGLSSSIFWPIASVLAEAFSWRGICAIYAGMMVLVSLPLYLFALPADTAAATNNMLGMSDRAESQPRRKATFYLMVAAIALNAFVTFGFSAIFIELLKAVGLPALQAVAFGSALGVIQVGARAMDFLGGGKWDGISTGIVAGTALPAAMAVLILGQGSHAAAAAFVILYGLGSGALAVARATIPLVFYDKAEYAAAASRIALPLNLMSALSPPLFIALLTRFGSNILMAVAICCSGTAVVLLLLLARHRPSRGSQSIGFNNS